MYKLNITRQIANYYLLLFAISSYKLVLRKKGGQLLRLDNLAKCGVHNGAKLFCLESLFLSMCPTRRCDNNKDQQVVISNYPLDDASDNKQVGSCVCHLPNKPWCETMHSVTSRRIYYIQRQRRANFGLIDSLSLYAGDDACNDCDLNSLLERQTRTPSRAG